MALTKRVAAPRFTQPVRQIVIMLIVLGLVAVGAKIAYPRVSQVFLANPWLNGAIALVFLIGVIACFWQVFELFRSVSWIEGFASQRVGHELVKAPRLLAPLAALLRSREAQSQISSTSARSILDSVATRIDEARDITRYIVNLLIFLGLLGTFWGLATTVPAVVDTIRSLEPRDGEGAAEVFTRLMSGLESQLGGMGVAFSSSLLGLAGSLIVGLLELFANHGQNRFYQELEEWLSSITRLGFSDSDTGESGIVSALLEQFSEQVARLEEALDESGNANVQAQEQLSRLCSGIETLVEKLGAENAGALAMNEMLHQQRGTLERIADGQKRVAEILDHRVAPAQEQLAKAMLSRPEKPAEAEPLDAESRMRLRSIDVQLLRILEELSAGRQEMLADLRSDMAALTRALGAASRRGGAAPAERAPVGKG